MISYQSIGRQILQVEPLPDNSEVYAAYYDNMFNKTPRISISKLMKKQLKHSIPEPITRVNWKSHNFDKTFCLPDPS